MKKLVVQNLLKVWLCAMVSFMTVTLYAQGNSFKVSGTVKDNTGELVIGATVIDTKTKNGCVTDVDGNFSLEVTPNSSIKVSFIGYKSQTIAIKAEQKVYNVILQSDNVLIDELVVVGYGVKKKQTLTGAVSAVNTKDIVSTKNESLQNMLTGKIAGFRGFVMCLPNPTERGMVKAIGMGRKGAVKGSQYEVEAYNLGRGI